MEEETKINNHIAKIENILKAWRMRYLTIVGKIVLFKSLATGFDKDCDYFYCIAIEYYKKKLYLARQRTKIKHSTLYKNGDLKDVDIFYKIISLQCSWTRR